MEDRLHTTCGHCGLKTPKEPGDISQEAARALLETCQFIRQEHDNPQAWPEILKDLEWSLSLAERGV